MLAAPLVCTAAWQFTLRSVWGALPLTAEHRAFGLPFVGLSRFVLHELSARSSMPGLWAFEVCFIFGSVIAVALSLGSSGARRYEKLGWIVALATALSCNDRVWVEDWAFMRVLTELYVFGIIVLFDRSDNWIVPVAAAAGALWLASGVMRIHMI